jgi:hypothetical protein
MRALRPELGRDERDLLRDSRCVGCALLDLIFAVQAWTIDASESCATAPHSRPVAILNLWM